MKIYDINKNHLQTVPDKINKDPNLSYYLSLLNAIDASSSLVETIIVCEDGAELKLMIDSDFCFQNRILVLNKKYLTEMRFWCNHYIIDLDEDPCVVIPRVINQMKARK